MKKILRAIVLVGAMLMVLGTFQSAAAAPPDHIKSDMFICPSVSPNNPNGMWVIGGSGAYHIILPASKSPNWNTMDHLNPFKAIEDNPADVEGQAQVKAGKGLYGKLPTYPYFEGEAMVLPDDGEDFILNTFGLVVPEGPITVELSDVASYDGGTKTLYANVPLKAAVFW